MGTFIGGIAVDDLSAKDRGLVEEFDRMAREGRLSPGVVGVGTLKVMGTSGDQAIAYPQVENLAALETLSEPESFVLAYARRVAEAKVAEGRQGRPLIGSRQAGAYNVEPLAAFDPTYGTTMVLAQLQGG